MCRFTCGETEAQSLKSPAQGPMENQAEEQLNGGTPVPWELSAPRGPEFGSRVGARREALPWASVQQWAGQFLASWWGRPGSFSP